MSEIVIEAENLVKNYQLGKVIVPALRGLSFKVRKGEFLVIMGPSGSGKSTLLNLIGGLDKPTEGKVIVCGQDLSKLSEKELINFRRHKVGFVFQFYNLIPVLTAYENIELPMLIAGYDEEYARRRVEELLKMIKLEDRAHHKPDELSGGEQQRVAIARALANKPEIVLADEPTGDLDSETGRHVMQFLHDLAKKEGVTVVVVTHDPIVLEFADRILHLRDGKIVKEELVCPKCKNRYPSNMRKCPDCGVELGAWGSE